MAITFAPPPAAVLLCDYTTGFVPPEMTKLRPVIVLSRWRERYRSTILVVPCSTTRPNTIEAFHVRISAGAYTFFRRGYDVWVKADMVTAVSPTRLSRIGRQTRAHISPGDFRAVQRAVLYALGLERLTWVL